MLLLFWICTILLALAVIVGYRYPPAAPWGMPLVVIDLVLLGLHVFGAPR